MVSMSACNKNDDEGTGTSRMEVRLTDAPGDYEKVLIDIRSVEIHTDANAGNNSSGWQTLTNINPGIYNLLDFANGQDTLLASANAQEINRRMEWLLSRAAGYVGVTNYLGERFVASDSGMSAFTFSSVR